MTWRTRLRAGLGRVPGLLTLARLTLQTFNTCLRYRVTGLAAEAAFYMLLSLPPLVLGLFGGLGYVGRWLGPETVSVVVESIEQYALRFLTEASVTELVLPTIEDVLRGGRAELVSVGFLLSIWSGSRALNVFVDTISIMYGQKDVRGIVHMRAVSIVLYVIGILAAIVTLPLVLVGPELVRGWLPSQLDFIGLLYWPFVLLLSVAGLTTLYQVSMPRRASWWRDVPGAALALVIWLLASVVVRVALQATLGGSTTIFGPLSTPIVLLIWLYTLAIAILIGAGLNAATRVIWPVRLFDPTSRRLISQARSRFRRPAVSPAAGSVGASPTVTPAEVALADSGPDAGGPGESCVRADAPAGADGSGDAMPGFDDEATRRALEQQFAKRERSAFAEAIERELSHGLRGGRDADPR
ncbi:YihY/virulence factor BrkB family protein [Terracoccus luteus]|uniref:Membrane protein n=1 Tax=Terracoccus luteus TaxID=53356 RepID=A0A839PYB1_9MICO|nr:YihY/virulence factor BrkB family protein [Terracoccus luteus]MBB2988123.1 membrane protein [Terracoccus luteus]MCP2174137.1 membrane protein [Terracoccus luteus]